MEPVWTEIEIASVARRKPFIRAINSEWAQILKHYMPKCGQAWLRPRWKRRSKRTDRDHRARACICLSPSHDDIRVLSNTALLLIWVFSLLGPAECKVARFFNRFVRFQLSFAGCQFDKPFPTLINGTNGVFCLSSRQSCSRTYQANVILLAANASQTKKAWCLAGR